MTIAVDIDEVLSRLVPKFLEFYNKLYQTSFSAEHFGSYDWSKILGISDKRKCEIYSSFCDQGHLRNLEVIAGAQAGIESIKRQHQLIIITNRALALKNDTEHWLAKHFPKSFAQIIYTREKIAHPPKSKQEICQQIKADIMIEDDPSCFSSPANTKTKLLLFNHPWNQNVSEPSNLVRVHSWEQIVNEINNS